MAQEKRTKTGNVGKRRVLLVLELLCIVIAIVCGFFVYQQLSGYWKADNNFKNITETYGRDVLRLETDNPNCVGWVSVADTRIDYPVMYTPDDPEYYLHRNFEGEYSASGTPFLGAGCDPYDGNSLIIYGHHMNNGSMFADLIDFDNPDFGLTHSIAYKTTAGLSSYKPISCFYEDLTSPDYYPYWENVGTLDKQRFDDFVAKVKEKSLYDMGATAVYGNKLLMLSTCSYGTAEQRFVVVAVRQ